VGCDDAESSIVSPPTAPYFAAMPPDSENSGLDRVRHELRADGIKDASSPIRSGVHSRGYLPHAKREGAE